MLSYQPAQVAHIYVNSTDQWQGRPLYSAIVQACLDKGAAGATVIRCVEGFGSHHELHTTRLFQLSENLPVRVEVIELPDKLIALLQDLQPLLVDALVTVTETRIVKVN